MKKLVLVLAMLLALSCSKDEECYCIEKTYEAVKDGDGYKFELYNSEVIECVDEILYWDYDNRLVIIKCY